MFVTDLEFPNDVIILGKEPTIVQPVLDRITCKSMTVSLELNTSETKFCTSSQDLSPCIYINGNTFEWVLHFKYLDTTIQRNNKARN